jgi:hypothetical protein
MTVPDDETRPALVELRRYRLRPGRRDELLALFDAELVEPQEAVGLQVLGQFRDADAPEAFVWLRGFAGDDPHARGRALAAFYGGPAWARHAEAANATMLDSDDVLLLRPARGDVALVLEGHRPAGEGEGGAVVATTCLLARPAEATGVLDAVLDELVGASSPHARLLAALVTADVPNAFARLPVREGEHALVWLHATDGPPPGVPAALEAHLREPAHVARLEPTARSRVPGAVRSARGPRRG